MRWRGDRREKENQQVPTLEVSHVLLLKRSSTYTYGLFLA